MTAFNLAPQMVNTDQGAATVKVTATVTDDWAGVIMVMCVLTPPSGSGSVAVSLTRDSGDVLAGAYSGTLKLPAGDEGGAWTARLALQDGLYNSGPVTATALEALFGAGSATVTNASLVWDSAAPQITALSITPTEVNTESSPADPDRDRDGDRRQLGRRSSRGRPVAADRHDSGRPVRR